MNECYLWGPTSSAYGLTVRTLNLYCCKSKWWSNAPYCLNFWVMISNGIHWWHFLLHGCHNRFWVCWSKPCIYSQALSTFACAALPRFKSNFSNHYLFGLCDDTMELPFDSRENEYWLFFLIQFSSKTNAVAFGNHEERFQLFEFQELDKWCCC